MSDIQPIENRRETMMSVETLMGVADGSFGIDRDAVKHFAKQCLELVEHLGGAIPVDEAGRPNRGLYSADNVVRGNFQTVAELSPEVVLEGARQKLSEVVVLGWEKAEDGNGAFYFAASDADMSRALMLLVRAQRDIAERMQ